MMILNEHVKYWNECLQIIKDNLNEDSFNTWFTPIVPLKFEDKIFVLQVPSQFFVEHIEEKYIDILSMTLNRVVGEGTKLEYRVLIDRTSGAGTSIPSTNAGNTKNNNITTSGRIPTAINQRVELPAIDSQLNPLFSFDTLIEGDNNKLARSAGKSIAEKPGKTIFNPLFVHGKTGVGKTHLVNAIGLKAKQENPEARVLYVPANTFQIQYTDAVRSNTQNDFLNFYQTIDVLIIDDIQEFAGKTGTQNTYFHIFNHLHQNGKQLILTSDRAPVELQGMEQRLLTRFKWGLTTEMEKPNFELRKAILKAKIYRDGLDITDDVVEFIAENITDNVRDLEGVVNSLLAHSTLLNLPIDISLAEKIVHRISDNQPKVITIEMIRDRVCEYFNLPVDAILTKSRKMEVVQARQIAMYLSKQMTQKSLSAIGQCIGKRDHATVLHACKKVVDLMETDKQYKKSVEEIEKNLKK